MSSNIFHVVCTQTYLRDAHILSVFIKLQEKKNERNQINKMLNHSQGQTVQKTLPLTASLGLFNHPSFPFTKHHTLTS